MRRLARDDPFAEGFVQYCHEVRIPDGAPPDRSYTDPFELPVKYSPSDKKVLDLELAKAQRLLRPHLLLTQVLASQFNAIKYRQPGVVVPLIRLMMRSCRAAKQMR